jgi:glycosyltransferase involved in cell wall biosynthesis
MIEAVSVLIITSGHEATDPRIYAKQAHSLQRFGAMVTVVGKLEYSTPGEVEVLVVPKLRSRLTRFLWQPWRCLWAVRWQHADIIHFHDAEMLLTLPVAKLWWRRSKFVYDVHEDFAALMLIRDWLPAWLRPTVRVFLNTTEKGLAWLADAIIGVTPPLADHFPHKHKIVAYNYVARAFFDKARQASRAPQQREFDLIHLGTLNPKRAIFLADILQELYKLRPCSRALIIGMSADMQALLKTRIPSNCELLGKIPYTEIPRLLGNAKVGLDVHPWLSPHLEVALPVKVCEYMAAGCAVVSSAMPVLNQLLAEAGADPRAITLIQGGKPRDYAEAVVSLIEAIETGADPGGTLHALAREHMTWEKESAKIAQLYLQLLGKLCVT